MPDCELQDTQSDQNDTRTSEPGKSGPFKWFVLITYIIFSSSLGMAQILFVPIPKQTAVKSCTIGKIYFTKIEHNYLFSSGLSWV